MIFCINCDRKIKNHHGNQKTCNMCSKMLKGGFVKMDEYVNSPFFYGERWGTIGANSSMEAMEEVAQMFKG